MSGLRSVAVKPDVQIALVLDEIRAAAEARDTRARDDAVIRALDLGATQLQCAEASAVTTERIRQVRRAAGR